MGRSRTITDEQILEAAREVFLAEGFGGSTLEIARRAGISEGSIFKRFPTKEKLFFAAMGILDVPEWVKQLKTLPGQGELKENLVALSLEIIEFQRDVLPRILMMQARGHSSPIDPETGVFTDQPSKPSLGESGHPDDRARISEPPLVRDLKALTTFFEAEIQQGRMQPCDPEIAARTLLGTLASHVLLELTLHSSQTTEATLTYVREFVDLLWRGMALPESKV